MDIDLKAPKTIHFIGIGGIGISAIARMMLLEGKTVYGSDRSKTEVTDALEQAGAKIYIGQKAENISPDTELVIYTIAITDDNPELAKAKELGITCVTYPQALGQLSKEKYTIAVSGAHGKTTTTAMIAKMLIDAKMDPTVVVGSFLKNERPLPTSPHGGGEPLSREERGRGEVAMTNFIAGSSKYLVAEACEYRRSFLNLTPTILVITNIDDDHLDYYKDIEDIKSAFKEMISKVVHGGYVVCDREQPYIQDVIGTTERTVVDYELFGDQNLKLKVPGQHNISNAAAVLAVADILAIPRAQAKKSLEEFGGTWRRFEYKGETKNGALVYDDYGHHPTEVKATLRGAREMFPDKRIVVVFQPHLYSRTKQHLADFGTSFNDVDDVIVAPIYAAREENDPTISATILADEINKNRFGALALSSFDEIKNYLEKTYGNDEVIITMGAGDIYTVGEALVSHKRI